MKCIDMWLNAMVMLNSQMKNEGDEKDGYNIAI